MLKHIDSIQYVSIIGYIYNYIPHSKERLTKNYQKWFEDRELLKNELEILIKHRGDKKNQIDHLFSLRVQLSVNIIQSIMALCESKMLSNKVIEYIEMWIIKNKMNSIIPYRYFKSIKSFIYYGVLRYKLWSLIPIFVKIKKSL